MRRVSLCLSLSLSVSAWGCAPTGSSAYVSFNIPPDSNCIVSPSVTNYIFLPEGTFDISKAGSNTACDNKSYRVNLLVNSTLRPNKQLALGRAEPNVLQIHDAEVTLKDVAGAVIAFNSVTPALPNPFRTTANNSLVPSQGGDPSTGIASLVAVPADYALLLANSKTKRTKILAEIQLFGTTTGDIDIDFKPFTYPIDLCRGCLTKCKSAVEANGGTAADVYGKECPDNAGADGRVCIDPEC